jgi:hypothetical protein
MTKKRSFWIRGIASFCFQTPKLGLWLSIIRFLKSIFFHIIQEKAATFLFAVPVS